MGQITCKAFTDFLIRRSEHLDNEIIKDVTPTDGWIGHVSTGKFPAMQGVSHTYERINRVFPNLVNAWGDVTYASCIGTPCDFTEQPIGFGHTRMSYKLQQQHYRTDLFCFDKDLSADFAKEQYAAIVSSLKDVTNIVMSDRMKTEAFRGPITKFATGAAMQEITFTETGNMETIVPSALPTSKLNVKSLQRMVQPLMLNGALGANPNMPPIFELVTDQETAWELRENNVALVDKFRFTDFTVGGALFKYGITDAIGNYGIRVDNMPIRFQLRNDGVTLERVYPYVSIPATQGIKAVVNPLYTNAHFQIDFIWNRMAMQNLVRDSAQLNPQMPFAARDFGGKWQFVMDNLGADPTGCVIENKRRNKGLFIADFELATKWNRQEWVIAFLSLREPACVVDVTTCSDNPTYSTQDFDSENAGCTTTEGIG